MSNIQTPYLDPRDQAVVFVPPQNESDLRVPTAEELATQAEARVFNQIRIAQQQQQQSRIYVGNQVPSSNQIREVNLPGGMEVYARGHPLIKIPTGGYSVILPDITSSRTDRLYLVAFNYIVDEFIDNRIRFTFSYKDDNGNINTVDKENTRRVRSGWILVNADSQMDEDRFKSLLPTVDSERDQYKIPVPNHSPLSEGWDLRFASDNVKAYLGSLPIVDNDYIIYSLGVEVVPILSFTRSPGDGDPDFSAQLDSNVWELNPSMDINSDEVTEGNQNLFYEKDRLFNDLKEIFKEGDGINISKNNTGQHLTITTDESHNNIQDPTQPSAFVSAPNLSGDTEVAPDGSETQIEAFGSSSDDPDASSISYQFSLEAGTLSQSGNVATVSFGLNQANSTQTLTAIAIDDQGNRSDASTLDISVMPAGMEPGDGLPSSDPSMGKPKFQLVIPSYNNGNFRYGVAEAVNIMFLEEPASDAMVKYFWQVSFDGGSTWVTAPFSDNQIRNPELTLETGDTNSTDDNIYIRCEVEVDGVAAMETSNELTAFSTTQSQTLTSSETPVAQNLVSFSATWTANANELEVQESGNTPFSANDTVFVKGEIDTLASAGSTGNPQTVTLNNLDGNDGDSVTIELATSRYDYPDSRSLSGTAVEARAFYTLSRQSKLSVNKISSDQFEIFHTATQPFLTNDSLIAVGDTEVKTSASNVFREPEPQPNPVVDKREKFDSYLGRADVAFGSSSKAVVAYESESEESNLSLRAFQIRSSVEDPFVRYGPKLTVNLRDVVVIAGIEYIGNNQFAVLYSTNPTSDNNEIVLEVYSIANLTLTKEASKTIATGFGFVPTLLAGDTSGQFYIGYIDGGAGYLAEGTIDASANISIGSQSSINDANGNPLFVGRGIIVQGNLFLVGSTESQGDVIGFYILDASLNLLTSDPSVYSGVDVARPTLVTDSGSNTATVILPLASSSTNEVAAIEVSGGDTISVQDKTSLSNSGLGNRFMTTTPYRNTGEFFIAWSNSDSRGVLGIGSVSNGNLTVSSSKTTEGSSSNFVPLSFTAYYDSNAERVLMFGPETSLGLGAYYNLLGNPELQRTVVTTANSLPNNLAEVESIEYQIKADLDGSGGLQNVTTNTHIVDDATLRVEGTFNNESGGTATFRLRKDHTDRQDETIMTATSEYDF